MEMLADYHLPSGAVIQLVATKERAGRSMLTLDFDDLERKLAAMRERGVETSPVDDTTSDKVLIATTTRPRRQRHNVRSAALTG